MLLVEAIKSVDAQNSFTGIDIEIFFQADECAERILCRIEACRGIETVYEKTANTQLEAFSYRLVIVTVFQVIIGSRKRADANS